jgi:hypothetical protein
VVLISESYGDSNRCTPYRGKHDQHAIHIPRSVRVWSQTIHISRGQHIAIFHESPTDLDGSHCSQEKGLPTQSPAHRSTDPRVCTQFLSQANQWSSRLKPSFCRWQATRLTGPISPACNQYVQYLLTEANHRSLIDTGGGYSLEGAGFPYATPQPSQPTVSPFHLRAPPGLQFNHRAPTNQSWVLKNLWLPHGLPTTRPSTMAYNYA